jgi:hypothetical protein
MLIAPLPAKKKKAANLSGLFGTLILTTNIFGTNLGVSTPHCPGVLGVPSCLPTATQPPQTRESDRKGLSRLCHIAEASFS